MYKITKLFGRRSFNKGSGRAVSVVAFPAPNREEQGTVEILFRRRLTAETMGDKRTITPAAVSFRKKRELITGVSLTPQAALMLREALDEVLDGAEIVRI